MAYKYWAVSPPQGSSPSPLPAEAFLIHDSYSGKTDAQEWLDTNGYEGYEAVQEVYEITGGGGGIRPTGSGGRPVL